jgi:pimeloyl-ACP methyl ester carboxylesterase
MRRIAAALVLAAGFAVRALAADPMPPTSMPAPAAKNDYSQAGNWLCLPGTEGACDANQDATVVSANGAMKPEKFKPAKNPPVDCFYVYPTVSRDPGVNSDMLPGVEEMGVVAAQFARFADVCTPYAPMYRQFTLTALVARQMGRTVAMPTDPQMAYHDVVDAWNYYLEHYNKGRPVVLVGHSQGSGMLTRLIKDEIDGKPIQKQVLVAILGGTRLGVPAGKDVGGDFQSVPLCHDAVHPGCAIAFASFRSTVPPPANTLFGKVQTAGWEAACVNPAALGGGSGATHSYLSSGNRMIVQSEASAPFEWVKGGKPVTSPFVSVPGLITAECTHAGDSNVLSITVHGDPKDPRADDIRGDVVIGGQVQANWGLHLIDMGLFMGNFQDIVRSETRAYFKKK